MSLEGKITLTFYPPDYSKSESLWNSHPDLDLIADLLGTNVEGEDLEIDAKEDFLTDSEEEVESDDSETNSQPVIKNKFEALSSCLENN